MGWAAVVLAGGAAKRLGGLDKPALTVGAATLLDHVLGALAGDVPAADPVVVVGPRRPTGRAVRWTREEPAGSGPLAGLAAGLAALAPDEPDEVAVLAADLVGLRPDTPARLRAALRADPAADGVVLTDDTGHPQWLTGVWRCAVLRAALPADPAGRPLRTVLTGLAVRWLPARPGEARDVDTPEDLAEARRIRPPDG